MIVNFENKCKVLILESKEALDKFLLSAEYYPDKSIDRIIMDDSLDTYVYNPPDGLYEHLLGKLTSMYKKRTLLITWIVDPDRVIIKHENHE